MRGEVSPLGMLPLARWLRWAVQSRLRLCFLEVFYGELRFANHEHTARAQTEDRRRAGEDCQSGGRVEENRAAIVSNNGTSYGNEGGSREQAESGVKTTQRFYEELGAHG